MKALFAALPDRKRGVWAETAEDLANSAHKLVNAGDVVLVKGSKGSKVSQYSIKLPLSSALFPALLSP